MKLFLYNLILIVAFVSFTEGFSQQLLISQEEKEEIISYLDSADYRGALNTITEYKISEAREKIEQVFWDSKFKKADQLILLRLLFEFTSPFTHNYALAFIDSVNSLPLDYSGTLPSYLQAMASGILVQLGDNSKVNLFFNFVDEDSLNSTFSVINILPVIMDKVPEYEERAKNELIKYVRFSEYDNARYAALMPLYRKYGTEILALMLEVFSQDEEANNRQLVLDVLIKCCKTAEFHSLLKERLWSDPNYYVRYKIMGKLLGVYGTPEDYKFVLDYLPNEPDPKVKEYSQDDLELYKPPKPDSNSTIENLINNTVIQADTLYSYNWFGDLIFLNGMKNILTTAKINLQSGDSISCAINIKSFQDEIDYVYKDSLNTDQRFVTIEGWKFLYWNAQYILDRLPEPPANPNLVVSLKNSLGNQIPASNVMYYESAAGGWKDAVNNGDGTFTVITTKPTVSIRMFYEYANQTVHNVPAQNNTYTFQTVNASVQLKNSSGNLIDQGTVQYYAGAWRSFGTTVNGVANKELLPINYSFRMIYEYVPLDKQQDISTNSTVTFSTVLCTVKVTKANGQPLSGASTKYYSGAWRDIGLTNANGEATKELLPKSLNFRAASGNVSKDKQQDIGVNNLVEIQLNVP